MFFSIDSDDLLIQEEAFFKDLAVIMQMAVEPLIVLHDIPERLQVAVQFVDAIVAKVQFIGRRSVMGENKIDFLMTSHERFNVPASMIHFFLRRHLGVPPGNASNPNHPIAPDSVLAFE